MPLYHLAAVIERCRLFIGHDSGISHIAAAVGVPCVLMFGPTDPEVWGPANAQVRFIQAPGEAMGDLQPDAVKGGVLQVLNES